MNDFLLAQMVAAERLPAAHESKMAVVGELKNSLAGGKRRAAHGFIAEKRVGSDE